MVDVAQRQRATFPDAREQYIADEGFQRTVVDPLVRRSQDQISSYEGTGITPQVFPDYVTQNPNAFDMMNNYKLPGKGSYMGSPMFLDAGITNRNLGGAKVMNATNYLDLAADDYFLREFGHYLKRFLPGYDPEGDEFRQKKYREDNPVYDPNNPNHFMMEEEPEYIADLPISDVPFIPLNPERSNKEYSKFQVNANEALERENIQNAYNDFKMMGKDPMFFETSATSPNLIDAFKEHDMYEPGMDLMSLPYDADMSPSITMDEIMKFANTPRYNI